MMISCSGLLPHIAHQVRSHTNELHFAILTSGFTAVTNKFVRSSLDQAHAPHQAGFDPDGSLP